MSEDDRLVIDDPDEALADRLVDSRGFDERESPLFGGLDDGRRQRMLAAALETRGNPEQILLFEAIGDFDGDDRRLALGKRPGFVDDKSVDLFHPQIGRASCRERVCQYV